MTDKSNNRGFFGRRVTSWCSPPVGPPESKKSKAAKLGSVKEAGSHGAFSDNKTRWTYPPTAPPEVKDSCDCCEDTVTKLPKKHFMELELDTFEKWLKEAEPWSLEKTHLMTIVAEIACTEKLPIKYRTRASALIRSNVDDPIVATAVK